MVYKKIGLNTLLFIFRLDEKKEYEEKMKSLEKVGDVNIVFLNNALGFEFTFLSDNSIKFFSTG